MAQRTVSQNHDRRQGEVDSQVHPNTQVSFSYVVCRVRVIAAAHRLWREQTEGVHAKGHRETLKVFKRRVRLPALDFVEVRAPHPATFGEIDLRDQRGHTKATNVSAEHRTEGRRRLSLKNATSVCLSHIHRFHTIRNRTGKKGAALPHDHSAMKSKQDTKFCAISEKASEVQHYSR